MENTYLVQGFQNGYYLAKQNKELLDLFMNLHHHPEYLEGLKKGIKEYDKTLEKKTPVLTKLQKRKEKLKRIKNKDLGKEEYER